MCSAVSVLGLKIAIATIEKNENSQISSRGGRSPYFTFFDRDGKFIESISNPFALGGGGAGVAVAKMLADKDVETVVVSKVGEKMQEALKSRGVNFLEKEGVAKDIAGELAK